MLLLQAGNLTVALPWYFTNYGSPTFLTAGDSYWHIAMVVAGVVCFLTGIACWRMRNLNTKRDKQKTIDPAPVKDVVKDTRLAVIFSLQPALGLSWLLTIWLPCMLNHLDGFGQRQPDAMLFGLMNIFARTLGGFFGIA